MPRPEGFASHVRGELERRIQTLSQGIIDGGCKDFAEYRYRCGVIQGLNEALREIKDTERKLRDED